MAENRATPVPNMKGTGGVSADVLDLDWLSLAYGEIAKALALGNDLVHLARQPALIEAKVDESRWGDLNGGDFAGLGQERNEPLSDGERTHLRGAGKPKR